MWLHTSVLSSVPKAEMEPKIIEGDNANANANAVEGDLKVDCSCIEF